MAATNPDGTTKTPYPIGQSGQQIGDATNPQSQKAAVSTSNNIAVAPKAEIGGGWTPLWVTSAAPFVKTLVGAAGARKVGYAHLSNAQAATASYVALYDAATTAGVTLGTTAPVWEGYVPAVTTLMVNFTEIGLQFVNGCVVFAATASKGATGSTTGMAVNIGYI